MEFKLTNKSTKETIILNEEELFINIENKRYIRPEYRTGWDIKQVFKQVEINEYGLVNQLDKLSYKKVKNLFKIRRK